MTTVTALQREIAREERLVGIRTDRPLTDTAIAHRRVQIGALLIVTGLVAVFAGVAASGIVQLGAIAVAFGFGVWALETDRHLNRLARLRGDAHHISLVVADGLLLSGALWSDDELLDLRAAVACAGGRLAQGLAELIPADCARVRLAGPSSEVPIAAELGGAPDDPRVAREAVMRRRPVRQATSDGRTVLAVPLWRRDEVVGAVEVVSPAGSRYVAADAALVDAFARGAISALLTAPVSP